jgi:hypothetical protein
MMDDEPLVNASSRSRAGARTKWPRFVQVLIVGGMTLTILGLSIWVGLLVTRGSVFSMPLSLSACNGRGVGAFGASACSCFSCYRGDRCQYGDVQQCTLPLQVGDPAVFREFFANRELAGGSFQDPFMSLSSSYMLYGDTRVSVDGNSTNIAPIDLLAPTISQVSPRASSSFLPP